MPVCLTPKNHVLILYNRPSTLDPTGSLQPTNYQTASYEINLISCQTSHFLNCQRSALTFLTEDEAPPPPPPTCTQAPSSTRNILWGVGWEEGREEAGSLALSPLAHPSSAPRAPALQLVPLKFPPQLIIVTDYLTASPAVTCLGLTD